MIHFIIGTRAQLFKMAPIMLECKKQGLQWRWIYAAQHKDTIKETLNTFGLPKPDYTIVKWDSEAKTIGKMYIWFAKMIFAIPNSKKILGGYIGKENIVLTHGDTLTTWLGAIYGKVTGTKVMHIESGLRSFNIWEPFPEEINRLITFRLSDYYACPGDWAVGNLSKYRGKKINTNENTQIDTIRFGLEHADDLDFKVPNKKYVVASLHRYENIFKKARFEKIIEELECISKEFEILMVQHPATYQRIDKLNLRHRIESNNNIVLLPRLEYLPFIKAIKHSEFVITDGGGNQEELYHIGKPTLIFRNETERQEGIGTTAFISGLDHTKILYFVKNYKKFEYPPTPKAQSPSKKIVDLLKKEGF